MSAVGQTYCTHTQVLSPKAARVSLGVPGCTQNCPCCCVSSPALPSDKRGVVGGRTSPRQCQVCCLSFYALVPRHQISKGIAKSALATGKKGPKNWAPALSRPLRMPLNKKLKEQRRTLLFSDRTKSFCRCITVIGRAADSAEANQPGRQWNSTSSQLPIPTPCLLQSRRLEALRTQKRGGPGPWEPEEF